MSIAIVGAGIGGLAAALSVHEAGHRDVRICERWAGLRPPRAGVNLLRQAVRELVEWGESDRIAELAVAPGTPAHRHRTPLHEHRWYDVFLPWRLRSSAPRSRRPAAASDGRPVEPHHRRCRPVGTRRPARRLREATPRGRGAAVGLAAVPRPRRSESRVARGRFVHAGNVCGPRATRAVGEGTGSAERG